MTSGHPIALLEVMVRRVLPVSAKKKKKKRTSILNSAIKKEGKILF